MDIRFIRCIAELTDLSSIVAVKDPCSDAPERTLMIQLPFRWISFPVQPNNNTSISVGKAVGEKQIFQLDVCINIDVHFTLFISEMRKPHALMLRAHVQCHLSLSAHSFLCN
ncbi:hypothetical protein TNCV_1801271 [Trichonephila clavipes]|nr:hypothetical protein TNCV_1801271 [Trichonephila clavipes]